MDCTGIHYLKIFRHLNMKVYTRQKNKATKEFQCHCELMLMRFKSHACHCRKLWSSQGTERRHEWTAGPLCHIMFTTLLFHDCLLTILWLPSKNIKLKCLKDLRKIKQTILILDNAPPHAQKLMSLNIILFKKKYIPHNWYHWSSYHYCETDSIAKHVSTWWWMCRKMMRGTLGTTDTSELQKLQVWSLLLLLKTLSIPTLASGWRKTCHEMDAELQFARFKWIPIQLWY